MLRHMLWSSSAAQLDMDGVTPVLAMVGHAVHSTYCNWQWMALLTGHQSMMNNARVNCLMTSTAYMWYASDSLGLQTTLANFEGGNTSGTRFQVSQSTSWHCNIAAHYCGHL